MAVFLFKKGAKSNANIFIINNFYFNLCFSISRQRNKRFGKKDFRRFSNCMPKNKTKKIN